ncbi:DVU3141 family protein [Halomonas sp. DN3]|uniref:DVU3141 family protein n=1 Tax=Halomonas sp. DN3 TaxID=2953657 RepID=UPI0034602F98
MIMFRFCTFSASIGVDRRAPERASGVPRANTFRRGAVVMLLLATVQITGCVQSPLTQPDSAQGIMSEPSGVPASSDLTRFLAQNPAGSATTLSSSPWGANVDVVADAPYFSASRRICRHLTVTRRSNGDRLAAVACKSGEGAWFTNRLVTALYNGAETW